MEAVTYDPETYSSVFNPDGSLKPLPKMSGLNRKKDFHDIPKDELQKLEKDGWKEISKKETKKKPKIESVKIKTKKKKGHQPNLTILKMPKNISRKEYNRIWMHNSRARQHLNKLKNQNAIRKSL